MAYCTTYDSPLGEMLLLSDGTALTGLYFPGNWPDCERVPGELPLFEEVQNWLDAYFRGEDPNVTFSLAPKGTPFQKIVWEILLTIPKGQTRSYGDIAREIALRMGKEKMSSQAVGQAVGRNPISIIIPCHRIVGARGQLTGYAGGLDRKRWLLNLEEVML